MSLPWNSWSEIPIGIRVATIVVAALLVLLLVLIPGNKSIEVGQGEIDNALAVLCIKYGGASPGVEDITPGMNEFTVKCTPWYGIKPNLTLQ